MAFRSIASVAAVAALFIGLASVKAAGEDDKKKDIVETAVSAKGFKTLVAAVKAAGLVEVLQGEGPFTVFAPTDEAFEEIPKDQLAALLKDQKRLQEVLTYHVLPDKVLAADVVKLESAETVLEKPVTIAVEDGKVKINEATVIEADIECANGVIHVIDAVLMPPVD
jgi:transforming growth factor-beta-induced protein